MSACMAPLLLRPLLAGECDIVNDFDIGGDGSVQLEHGHMKRSSNNCNNPIVKS